MSRSHLVILPPRCWLLLALLLLPLSASAQRRGRSDPEELDPVCRRSEGPCVKFRLGIVGGGVVTSERIGPGIGGKAGLSLVLLPRLELGIQALAMADVLGEGQPFIGAGEGLLRLAVRASKDSRLFLELSGGAALSDSPEVQRRVSPSATVGTSFEAATGYTSGVFVTAGLTVVRVERWTLLPHVGVGFFM